MSQIKLFHYRNGKYQGQVTKAKKRNGKGLLITDNGQIIIGSWKNDKLYGNAIIIYNPTQFAYGQFNRGKFQGWFVIQNTDKILVGEFNSDKIINKQLFIQKDKAEYKVIVQRNPIFQILKQSNLDNKTTLKQLIQNQLNIKLAFYSFYEYLQTLCKDNQYFQLATLPNGYKIFKFNDMSNPISLGFVFNKNNQIVSYGSYINGKLSGYGCKYQSSARYQGIFVNGFLNGQGLKYNAGKYSFGVFQNGSLVQPVYLEERSLASEQKLKQLKRLNHIVNLNFNNVYLPLNLIAFHGLSEIVFQISLKQQYILHQSPQKFISAKKQNNIASIVFSNQNNVSKQQIQLKETKSIYSISNNKRKQKNPQNDEINSNQVGKGFSGVNSLKKFRI